jgi:aspartyl-tRNA synthetase
MRFFGSDKPDIRIPGQVSLRLQENRLLLGGELMG